MFSIFKKYITENVIKRNCFTFNNFSSLIDKTEKNDISIFNSLCKSYVEGNYKCAADLELSTKTPSNAWMHKNCFKFKQCKAIICEDNSEKQSCGTFTKHRIE